MANIVKMKQSSVAGKVPLTTDLALGELAINTRDGKLYLKKNVSGVETIVDVTAGGLLPASSTNLGGVKGLTNLTIDATGALSLSAANIAAALGYSPVSDSGGTTANGAGMFKRYSDAPAVEGGEFAIEKPTGSTSFGSNISVDVYADTFRIFATHNSTLKIIQFPFGNVASASNVDMFPSGTAMVFAQTAAPTGWTKSTTHNDKALRVVSGTAGSGGTVAFSTVFSTATATTSVTSTGSVGSTTLATSQIPAHSHGVNVYYSNPTNMPGGSPDAPPIWGRGGVDYWTNGIYTNNTGGGGSHNHSLTMSAHSHSSNLNVQYVDVIIATKN